MKRRVAVYVVVEETCGSEGDEGRTEWRYLVSEWTAAQPWHEVFEDSALGLRQIANDLEQRARKDREPEEGEGSG